MPTQLLIFKGLASVGGAAAISGGSYAIYHYSDSNKNIFDNSNADGSTSKLISTNLFVVRYKRDVATATLDENTTLTCDIAANINLPCKIYQFGTTPKKDNVITVADTSKLTAVTTTNSAFVDNAYLVVELTNSTKTAPQLQNKIISLKKGSSTLGLFEFDQILTGKTAITAKPIEMFEETYIVKKPDSWKAEAATSYGCKYWSSGSYKTANFDYSCQLVKITNADTDTIATFDQLKSLTTKITPTALATDTASDTYYKLILKKDLMYNLNFDGSSDTTVAIGFLKDGTPKMAGKLEIQQKFDGTKFVGKTNLVLAKVKTTDAVAITNLANAKCSLTSSNTAILADQFSCTLYKATKGSKTNEKDLTFGATPLATSDTFTEGDYFVIKLSESKNIADFDTKQSIFYQISSDANEGTALTKNTELELVALMSGEVETNKNPMFIAEISTTK